jgi:hypothetical protein
MLEHYRDRNALRVYAHPYALRAHLAEAREAIARRRDRPQDAVADERRLRRGVMQISWMRKSPARLILERGFLKTGRTDTPGDYCPM